MAIGRHGMGGLLVAVLIATLAAQSVTRNDHSDTSTARLELAVGTPGKVRADVKGLDKCQAPTHAQMDAFWQGTDWWWWGIYIGGSMMSCDNANVTKSWIDTEIANSRWKLLFIWVGPQAPCSGFANTIPLDTTEAYTRGRLIAGNALDHAKDDLGLTMKDLPIVYDMENFSGASTACLAAVKAFMRGWTSKLHEGDVTQTSGYYGSSCASYVDDMWSISPNPDFIWGANWGTGSDTDVMSCVDSSHWTNTRHKQYLGEVQRTENGVTLTVDVNCATGPMYGIDDPPETDNACT